MKTALIQLILGSLLILGSATRSIITAPPPVIITEIQAEGNPGNIGDAIELFNSGEDPVDLDGWQLLVYDENDALSDTIVLGEYRLNPGEVVVISDANQVSTEQILYFPASSIFWQANEAGACGLLSEKDEGVDFVRWDGSSVTPPGGLTFAGVVPSSAMNRGTSLSRNSELEDSDSARDFCLRPATLGSPEHPDECLSEVVLINEITAEGPPGDDKIELYNRGRLAHNIENLQLTIYDENDALRDTLVLPDFTLQPGAYVVVHDSAGANSATDLFFDGAAIFWQINEPGTVGMLDGSVHGIDFVRWDASAVLPPSGTAWTGSNPSGNMPSPLSLSRRTDGVDTDDGSDWVVDIATTGEANPQVHFFQISDFDSNDSELSFGIGGMELGVPLRIQVNIGTPTWFLVERFIPSSREEVRRVALPRFEPYAWFRVIEETR